jgi:hypothetical protein
MALETSFWLFTSAKAHFGQRDREAEEVYAFAKANAESLAEVLHQKADNRLYARAASDLCFARLNGAEPTSGCCVCSRKKVRRRMLGICVHAGAAQRLPQAKQAARDLRRRRVVRRTAQDCFCSEDFPG